MKIYLLDDNAFVEFGKGYMLCIGTKKEVDDATPQKITEMVDFAIAYSKFRCLEIWKDTRVH